MAQRSLDLIEAMRDIAEAAQPITGRGVGYKLFTAGLIPSMARNEMQRVYRLLQGGARAGHHSVGVDRRRDPRVRAGRRPGTIPSNTPAASPDPIAATSGTSSRIRVEVWSEKGTVRGVLAAGARSATPSASVSMHGFSSATAVHDIAEDDDGRDLIVLYVGDFDPSGMFMSEEDLPARLAKYDGDHVTLKRIALTRPHGTRPAVVPGVRQEERPALQVVRRQLWASTAGNSTRWTRTICATASRRQISKLIEPVAWQRCEVVNKAEQEELCERSGHNLEGMCMTKAERAASRWCSQPVKRLKKVCHYFLHLTQRRRKTFASRRTGSLMGSMILLSNSRSSGGRRVLQPVW